ncbi:hypothetical protein [uncultured Erythrobacter sp.]|uniref:hypothetical protein n=1 Tax=uncultured Erythrobacter sp. TaxID=263913 RepID=UPI00261BEF8E|nr:hypothetical protein [uncultured Erythrobacter sp.]
MDAYSVGEVTQDITSADSKLHGKEIAVKGWLGQCGGLDCAIYPSLVDAKLVAEGEAESEAWSAAMDRRLSIGGADDFDRAAMLMQFSEVVLYGQVNATHKKPPTESGNDFGCWDRCDDIKPTSIELLAF